MIKQFAKAVFFGTFAGASLPTFFTTMSVLAMINDQSEWLMALVAGLLLILGPSFIVFCVVLPSSILIGLPVTAVLTKLKLERASFYATTGIVAGAAVTIAILNWMPSLNWMDAEEGWLIALGMFSGSVTGWVWGSEREFRAKQMT